MSTYLLRRAKVPLVYVYSDDADITPLLYVKFAISLLALDGSLRGTFQIRLALCLTYAEQLNRGWRRAEGA